MPSEAEVKIWIEHANEYSRKFDGFNPPWLVGLKSLASSWLGRKMPEKKEHELFCNDQQRIGNKWECICEADIWNSAIDAFRLASVVSEEEIGKIIWGSDLLQHKGGASFVDVDKLSHAIAEAVNGGGK